MAAYCYAGPFHRAYYPDPAGSWLSMKLRLQWTDLGDGIAVPVDGTIRKWSVGFAASIASTSVTLRLYNITQDTTGTEYEP